MRADARHRRCSLARQCDRTIRLSGGSTREVRCSPIGRAIAPKIGHPGRVIEGPGSPSPDSFVRLATAEDGLAIGDVHAAAWEAAFGHILSGEFLERAAAGRRSGWQYAIAQVLAGSNLLLVGGRDDDIMAFSQSGQPGDGSAGSEIFAFYCHPVAWGTGIADALMDETWAVLSTRAGRALLWTPSEAHRARRFYERHGFRRTGPTRSEPLSDWQPTPTYEEVPAVEYALSLG